jgi:hypothetical protein
MLSPSNKTLRVPPQECSETHEHSTNAYKTLTSTLKTLSKHFGSLGASENHEKHERGRGYL